jgi:hypothetical protein
MKKSFFALTLAAAVVLFSGTARAQSEEQTQRITTSYLVALGRAPSAAELNVDSQAPGLSIATAIERRRELIQKDAGTKRAVIIKAFEDAFGREPSEDEIRDGQKGNRTYSELMSAHVTRLAEHPTEYEQVMNRAYRLVIHRDIYPMEVEYWKKRSTVPYYLLAACLEDWARRNQPGLMVTSGETIISFNNSCLSTIQLSPKIAAEARTLLGLPTSENENAPNQASFGRNIVATGAAEIVSSGHINFVAAGSPSLLPSYVGKP